MPDQRNPSDECDHFWMEAAPSSLRLQICVRCGAMLFEDADAWLDSMEQAKVVASLSERDATPKATSLVIGRLERLRATFAGGFEEGGWWIWHEGLAIYGDADSYEEAKADLLEEIADAIDEWKMLGETSH